MFVDISTFHDVTFEYSNKNNRSFVFVAERVEEFQGFNIQNLPYFEIKF